MKPNLTIAVRRGLKTIARLAGSGAEGRLRQLDTAHRGPGAMTHVEPLQPDDAVRHWSSDCAIDFDDDYDGAVPEGTCIALFAAAACLAIVAICLVAAFG